MKSFVNDLVNRLRGRLTCAETLTLLQQYLDGELPVDEARRVAVHLDHCTMCEEESAVYARIKASIASVASGADPEVLARLERFGQRVGDGEFLDYS